LTIGGDSILYIEYEDEKVKELFEDLNNVQDSKGLMKRVIGTELTKAVKKRYNQIVSFSSFSALQLSGIGKMESLAGDRKESYSLHVSANYRLIVKPKSKDRSAEGLKKCDTLIIEGVIDYHGKGTKYSWIIP
jgi:proteic killer suppression protein/toxin YoeB